MVGRSFIVKGTTTCFGEDSTSSTSCGAFGKCVGNDTCSCDPNVAIGTKCETQLCGGKLPTDPKVCGGRGVCYNGDCACTLDERFGSTQHVGLTCEIPVCFPLLVDPYRREYECGGHGTCVETNICDCHVGYGGYDCTKTGFKCSGINATNSKVCSGRGQCIDQDYCLCQSDDYGGVDCSTPKCNGFLATEEGVCNGRGQCLQPNNCTCTSGFSGTNCELDASNQQVERIVTCYGVLSNDSVNVCSGKGSCFGNDYCSCQIGYTGARCNETFCFGVLQTSDKTCSGNGVCSSLNTCSCNNNSPFLRYVGEECGILQCRGVDLEFYNSTDVRVCSGRGACIDHLGCVCNEGYYGESCQISSCFSVLSNSSQVCNGHGICQDLDNCECYSNSTNGYWYGDDCSVCANSYEGNLCNLKKSCNSSTTCMSLGECSNNDLCRCESSFDGENCEECALGYYGPLCEIFCSAELNCSSNGVCSRDGFCDCYQSRELGYFQSENCSKCSPGYFGNDCSTFVGSNFTFNNYGNELILRIIPPLNIDKIQTENECKTFFPPRSRLKLGGEFTCHWIDVYNGYLSVLIPQNATIIPGDFLEFNVYSFEQYAKPAQYRNITSFASDVNKIITQHADIETATSFQKGTTLTIRGKSLISIERERELYYEWSIVNSNPTMNSLNSHVSSQSGWGKSVISIPSSFTSSVNLINLKLRIANYYQQFGSEKQVILQDLSTASSSVNQVQIKITTARNRLYILNDILPYKINCKLTVNGVQVTNIISSGYSIEWSLSPDLGIGLANLTLITLKPYTSDNSTVLFTSEDTLYYDFYNVPYTVFNVSAVVKKNGTVVSSDSLQIHFNLFEQKQYGITLSRTPTDMTIDAQYPAVISLSIPPEVTILSVEWACFAYHMYKGKCHDQYQAIIAQSGNKTRIELPKSAIFLHYNTVKFSVKITTTSGVEYRDTSFSPSASYQIPYAVTETAFFSSGYRGPFRLYSLHGTKFSFEYRLFDSTEPSIASAGDAPATTGTVTAYNVYSNNQITLSAANGITTYTDTYYSGPNLAKLVKVDMTKFSSPIYFQVKFTYKTLEMNVRQYLIIGTVPRERVDINVKVVPFVQNPEFSNYIFQVSNDVANSFYEVTVSLSLRYKNDTSMSYSFGSLSMFSLNREVKIAFPPLLDSFTIYKKVTYYTDSWVGYEHEESLYIYEEEVASFPASPHSSDPFIKAMQSKIKIAFEKGSNYLSSASSIMNSYY
ncbi:predicted protein [Naegleria gruberi]|uniref:Predicted protein n=1 Tax=Naegleria gruberi TaxID=5762 RepID=D2VZD2_NAEGR|nr:uncharacterized protein NAEGRDRAFT_74448 [Naegleria gruberi]EFC37771.1 predicted protein [Naegleria gruberi]|eukprot:XP_002670515.1 predicted protein [Naegleria gruberi strain NEG-M]